VSAHAAEIGTESGGRRGYPPAPRLGHLPLIVLELVGALAAQAVPVVPISHMLRPEMTTVGTVAECQQAPVQLLVLARAFDWVPHKAEHA